MVIYCENEKKQWILDYMLQHSDEFIDVFSENFVNAYIYQFDPQIIEYYPYGTPKVPELGRLLSELYKENKVSRYRHYCENWQDGYPRWFYSYFARQ